MQIDASHLDKVIESALLQTLNAVAHNADRAMTDDRWDWPNTTHRRNGSVVGSPRDIVDTGDLYRSRSTPVVKGSQGTITYNCEYADDVHALRPWLATALEETDVTKVFAEALRRLI
jgi:hypothetical protein